MSRNLSKRLEMGIEPIGDAESSKHHEEELTFIQAKNWDKTESCNLQNCPGLKMGIEPVGDEESTMDQELAIIKAEHWDKAESCNLQNCPELKMSIEHIGYVYSTKADYIIRNWHLSMHN
ncbi:uncharacterized protein LOC112904121 isoform X2 [Agrilus planipennis]|uniref:Uncharacterized protein LOC112904121 isoform X2 n=1 Tax=Agrilus planipennis TaxID=224129 RepID=A0A7F5R2F0_AGRPL|nr:uncharacterized protein LOC112904121 isoform X2 [Agrilus planipennis]XP_025829199.1 uncharacterized protein LOC112904121 isoform X2 [Agrilus planipennis]